MEVFVSLIIIVFGILQIILFFKLWGMTKDVRKLTEHFCQKSGREVSLNTNEENTTDDIKWVVK